MENKPAFLKVVMVTYTKWSFRGSNYRAALMREIFMMESIRKLRNFNFQLTKTLYQNNLNLINFFYIFKGYRYNYFIICNINTKDHFSWEPKKIKVKCHKKCENTGKILKISCVKCHFVKFDIRFLRLHEKFALVLLQITN